MPRAKPSLPLEAARAAGAAARARDVKVATRMLASVFGKMFQARMLLLWCGRCVAQVSVVDRLSMVKERNFRRSVVMRYKD